MTIKSDFAIIDVLTKQGTDALLKRTNKGERVPVTIRGFIVKEWSRYDGTSREFQVEVTSVEETPS